MESQPTPVEVLSRQHDGDVSPAVKVVTEAARSKHNVEILHPDKWKFVMIREFPGGVPTWVPGTLVGSCTQNKVRKPLVAHYHDPSLEPFDLSTFGANQVVIESSLTGGLGMLSVVDESGIRRQEHCTPYTEPTPEAVLIDQGLDPSQLFRDYQDIAGRKYDGATVLPPDKWEFGMYLEITQPTGRIWLPCMRIGTFDNGTALVVNYYNPELGDPDFTQISEAAIGRHLRQDTRSLASTHVGGYRSEIHTFPFIEQIEP
ncbi:MAG: hypothetical protein PHS44_07350 [Candidatus Dojkabacteria bacterium]|jgi:hypothetical protein|nr:hypothetical protein [Candidatus Dojkabacteria bacterium]